MELKDEEIKQALKCCGIEQTCRECPLKNEVDCLDKLNHSLLELINRQQAKIEKYEKESNKQFDKMKLLDDRTKQRYAELFKEAKEFVRTETIKEFAELIVADYPEMEFYLNNLLAKMAGVENK